LRYGEAGVRELRSSSRFTHRQGETGRACSAIKFFCNGALLGNISSKVNSGEPAGEFSVAASAVFEREKGSGRVSIPNNSSAGKAEIASGFP
jgi:hypothetical protein